MKWINFSNHKTGERFSYVADETVYVLIERRNKFENEDDEQAYRISEFDSVRNIPCRFLTPTLAGQVKIGQSIYDNKMNYEGYRVD